MQHLGRRRDPRLHAVDHRGVERLLARLGDPGLGLGLDGVAVESEDEGLFVERQRRPHRALILVAAWRLERHPRRGRERDVLAAHVDDGARGEIQPGHHRDDLFASAVAGGPVDEDLQELARRQGVGEQGQHRRKVLAEARGLEGLALRVGGATERTTPEEVEEELHGLDHDRQDGPDARLGQDEAHERRRIERRVDGFDGVGFVRRDGEPDIDGEAGDTESLQQGTEVRDPRGDGHALKRGRQRAFDGRHDCARGLGALGREIGDADGIRQEVPGDIDEHRRSIADGRRRELATGHLAQRVGRRRRIAEEQLVQRGLGHHDRLEHGRGGGDGGRARHELRHGFRGRYDGADRHAGDERHGTAHDAREVHRDLAE